MAAAMYAVRTIGRERDIEAVWSHVRSSRVVTVTGTGGIGKSRVAADVASQFAPLEFERTGFVDIASIADATLIPGAVARAFGIEFDPAGDPVEALVALLAQRRVLVVLDNCERRVDACAYVARALVRGSSAVHVLATSRAPLGMESEFVYRLGPLDEGSARELFTLHARQVDPAFAPADRESPVLEDICSRLDGIALSIQLAASTVHAMSLGELRSRLDGHFPLLIAKGRIGETPRHRTVEALIKWSHDVLSPGERVVFRRLGAFTGSFSREAAGAVAADATLYPDLAAGTLDALVEKSMVVRSGDRYRMLESIKQYALERLLESNDEPSVRRAFATYYAGLCERVASRFGFGTQDAWIVELAPDLDNLRAALTWARDRDAVLGMRLAANLADFWEVGSLAAEGLRRSEAVLAAIHDPGGAAALPLLLAVARLSMVGHVYWRSLEIAVRARALAERCDDAGGVAESRRIVARSRRILGIDTDTCVTELRDALPVIRAQGNPYRTARIVADYAFALIDGGMLEEGRQLLDEADALTASLDWPHLVAHVHINIAELEFRSGEPARAVDRGRALVAMLRPRGTTTQLALALSNLTAYLGFTGAYDEAYATAREAISTALARDMHYSVAWCLQSVALPLAARGEHEKAARLLGFTDAYCENTVSRREPTELLVAERLVQLLREVSPDLMLERERSMGRKLTERAAVTLAFGA